MARGWSLGQNEVVRLSRVLRYKVKGYLVFIENDGTLLSKVWGMKVGGWGGGAGYIGGLSRG